ncbi:hypothetical protein Dsin_028625 [Dipteronia sinensis]|uniref:MAGE domain-containing protein n=1 Tax=Dipteronia sinensis TaxID=43782 RepID=A0AAD9ZR83_9ROSI|nr:hypothetical protein Dsin_028625 [Dipteronia sinensis]
MPNNGENFSQFDISKEEIEKLVSELVRYVLFKSHQNFACPIKREELVQLVTKKYIQHSLPAFVINAANDKFSTVFSYELREFQRSHPSSTNQGRASQQNISIVQLAGDKLQKKDKVRGHEVNILFYELAERALDGPVSQKIKDYISQAGNFEVYVVQTAVKEW